MDLFVGGKISPPRGNEGFATYTIWERQEWCHQALSDGRADVMLDVEASLSNYLFKNNSYNCGTLSKAGFLNILPYSMVFVFNSTDHALARQLSEVINALTQHPSYTQTLNQYLFTGNSCDSVQEVSDTTPISFRKMSGLFMIALAVAVLAVLLAVIQRHHKWPNTRQHLTGQNSLRLIQTKPDACIANVELTNPHGSISKQQPNMVQETEAEMLKAVLAKVDALSKAVAAQGAASMRKPRAV